MHLLLSRFDFTYEALFQGISFLVIIVLYNTQRRPPTKEEVLQEKTLNLSRQNRQLRGHNLHQQGVAESLQTGLNRAQEQNKIDQLSQEKLNGELARERRRNRSLEFALLEERNKSRSTR